MCCNVDRAATMVECFGEEGRGRSKTEKKCEERKDTKMN
jgi:hypothetical protein